MRHLVVLAVAFGCGCGGRVEDSQAVDTGVSSADTSVLGDAGHLSDAADDSWSAAGDTVAADSSVPTLEELVKPCLAGGNIIYLDGDPGDFIHPGIETIVGGEWTSTARSARYIEVNQRAPTFWRLVFSSERLGVDLAVGLYEDAERAAFASTGHPGLDVTGNGRGCSKIAGRFRVHEIVWKDSMVASFTASFEQHCEAAKPALRGCVHYAR